MCAHPLFFAFIRVTVFLLFLVLIGLSFWLTFRKGKRILSISASAISSLLFIFFSLTEMGFITTIGLIILLVFLIIFNSYWTLINLNFRKTAKVIAIVFSLLALLPFLSFVLEDYFFFKSDAKKFLKNNDIVLTDDFKIKSNSISRLNDVIQKFELEISSTDKEKIIQQIRNSKYFRDTLIDKEKLFSKSGNRLTNKTYLDYEKDEFIIRETFQRLKIGYTSDHDIITISKNKNTLTFERIND